MEAKELRIGNSFQTIVEEIRVVDLEQLKKIQRMPNLYKPIPLTEEWLLKFGFELDGKQLKGKYYKIQFNYSNGFKDFISVSDKGAGYMFGLTSNYNKQSILPFNYKHVHSLQNLYFALTNKELTIK